MGYKKYLEGVYHHEKNECSVCKEIKRAAFGFEQDGKEKYICKKCNSKLCQALGLITWEGEKCSVCDEKKDHMILIGERKKLYPVCRDCIEDIFRKWTSNPYSWR